MEVYSFRRPDFNRYAVDLATRLSAQVDAGIIKPADLSDMLAENRILARKGTITPVFEAINIRVLNTVRSQFSSLNNLGSMPRLYRHRRISGLGSMAGLWDTIKGTASTIYDTGSDALSKIGDFIDITPGGPGVNINLPDVDAALRELKEKGLVRVTAQIPESIFGVPTWIVPVAIGAVVYLLLRRK